MSDFEVTVSLGEPLAVTPPSQTTPVPEQTEGTVVKERHRGARTSPRSSATPTTAAASAAIPAAMPSLSKARDPRHRPYGKGMRNSKGGAGKGPKRNQSRGRRSTVSTPQSIERAAERQRLSTFFNTLTKGTHVKVVSNTKSGHHDITNKRPELQDAVCEIVRTAVYPGTWLTIKPKGGDLSSHSKVRTSQIRLCEQQPRKSTGASRKQRRQDSTPSVAASQPMTSTRNAGGDGDSSDSAGSSPGKARRVLRRHSADPGAPAAVAMEAEVEIDPPAGVAGRGPSAKLAQQQEAALLASAHHRLRVTRWAGSFFRGLWAILGSRFAFAPTEGNVARVIKTASPWEQIDILHREATAHIMLRAELHSGPLEVVADLRELFRRHHRTRPVTMSSAQLARVDQAERWLDQRLWQWSSQGLANVPSPSTARTPPPRSEMMIEMSRLYVDASQGQLPQQLELLTASLFDGSDDGDMLAADRRLIASIANNLAAEIGPL